MIKSIVHRTIKNLERFDVVKDDNNNNLNLAENEEYLGVYKNDFPESEFLIYVTNIGLHVSKKEKNSIIKYTDIRSTKISSDKQDDYYISLILESGEVFELLINGKNGKFRDKFEFVRFLERVIK